MEQFGALWMAERSGGIEPLRLLSSKDIYSGGLAVNNLAAWLVVATPRRKTILYHTTNGGSSWTSTSLPKTYPIAYLSFVDARHGWLLASQGPANGQEPIELYRTSDGGKTWSQTLSKTESLKLLGENKTGITFVNRTTGWLTLDFGIQAGVVGAYVTHDAGYHWNPQAIPIPAGLRKHYAQPFPPEFSSPHVGLMPVVFDNGKTIIYRTENGGQMWYPTTPIPISQVVSMSSSDGTSYVTDGKSLYDSSDEGRTWGKWIGKVKPGDQIVYAAKYGVYVVTGGGSKALNIPLNTANLMKK